MEKPIRLLLEDLVRGYLELLGQQLMRCRELLAGQPPAYPGEIASLLQTQQQIMSMVGALVSRYLADEPEIKALWEFGLFDMQLYQELAQLQITRPGTEE